MTNPVIDAGEVLTTFEGYAELLKEILILQQHDDQTRIHWEHIDLYTPHERLAKFAKKNGSGCSMQDTYNNKDGTYCLNEVLYALQSCLPPLHNGFYQDVPEEPQTEEKNVIRFKPKH